MAAWQFLQHQLLEHRVDSSPRRLCLVKPPWVFPFLRQLQTRTERNENRAGGCIKTFAHNYKEGCQAGLVIL